MEIVMIKDSLVLLLGTLLIATGISCAPKPSEISIATPSEIKARIESSTAPLVLVHVWATWCDPCRDEFPELMEIYSQFKNQGLELILVSADDPTEMESVEQFLQEQNCSVGSLVSTELSQKFIEVLSPNWGGSLPSSFFYANGKLLHEWAGKRSYEVYAEQIESLLSNPKES
jgi:thiol-disulfide isomerase/thioredoxin